LTAVSVSIDELVPVEGKSTVRVRLGTETFEIARETADALGLVPGLEVGPALRTELEAAAERRAAAARVLRYLRTRPRTVREVHDHLAQHGHAAATIRLVVAELQAKGLVDDARFAAWFVQARQAHRVTGPARLQRELAARGVGRELAAAAIAAGAAGDELEMALAAARPRFAAAARLGRERGLRRLQGFLGRRGFRETVVRTACLQLFATVASDPKAPRPRTPRRPIAQEET
jgi:regulatory protein